LNDDFDTWCACIVETGIQIASHNLAHLSKNIPKFNGAKML